MAQPPAPILYTFTEILTPYKTVKHYDLQETIDGTPLLSNQINIARNRNFAKSSPDYWVKTREGSKWSKTALTGLFKTPSIGFYHGDHDSKKHLLVFQFNRDASRVNVFYFQNYYTRNLKPVLNLMFSRPPETKKPGA